MFVLLYFFFWPLCCLFFFDIQILITPFYLQTLLSPSGTCMLKIEKIGNYKLWAIKPKSINKTVKISLFFQPMWSMHHCALWHWTFDIAPHIPVTLVLVPTCTVINIRYCDTWHYFFYYLPSSTTDTVTPDPVILFSHTPVTFISILLSWFFYKKKIIYKLINIFHRFINILKFNIHLMYFNRL